MSILYNNGDVCCLLGQKSKKHFNIFSGDDQENPYDNLSEHTTKESLADTVSIKSRIKTPLAGDQVSMGGGGSTIDVKSTSLEQNE